MTEGVLATVEEWTGDRPVSCPWRAFWDPFVQQVLRAREWFEKGQLALLEPEPSHRLIEGITHLSRMSARIRSKQWALEKADLESRREGGR